MTQGEEPNKAVFHAQPLWKKEWRSKQHSGNITKLIPLSCGTKLASVGRDSLINVYRSKDLTPLQSIETNSLSWCSDAITANLNSQKRLVTSHYDRSIVFYNVLEAERSLDCPDETSALGLSGTFHLPVSAGPATCLGTLPSPTDSQEQQLVFGDQHGAVHLLTKLPPTMGHSASLKLDMDSPQLHKSHTDEITQLLYIPHLGLLSASLDGKIGIFDPVRGDIAETSQNLHKCSSVRCIAYHEPLTLAISGGSGRSAVLWHPKGDPNTPVAELRNHSLGVLQICTTTVRKSSENHVITLSGDRVVSVWDLRTLKVLQRLENSNDFPNFEDAKPTAIAVDIEKGRLFTGTQRPCLWEGNDDVDHHLTVGREKEELKPVAVTETESNTVSQNIEVLTAQQQKQQQPSSPMSWRRAHSRLFLGYISENSFD